MSALDDGLYVSSSSNISPPSIGDLLIAASSLDWPPLEHDGRTFEGESGWREFLAEATDEDRLQVWQRDWKAA